jgi:hypothetical protein
VVRVALMATIWGLEKVAPADGLLMQTWASAITPEMK